MSIEPSVLAGRLKEARVSVGLIQEQAAAALGIPRTAIVQIESGNRAVSTLELARLAELYRRPIASFFEPASAVSEEDVLVTLFRAAKSLPEQSEWRSNVARYVSIFREGVALQRRLRNSTHDGPPTYQMTRPQRVMEAVEQGTFVAEQERRRLGLGHNPISDMVDLINGQGLWASGAVLPDELSGLFMRHSSIGLCVLVNCQHPRSHKRFSYAHEYAHSILDREQTATVCLEQNRSDLNEIRANAFAAAFLLPRQGVWAFLNGRDKAGPSLVEQFVYDPTAERGRAEVRGRRRALRHSRDLTYYDVAALAHHYGVSYQASLFRLKSLAIIDATEFGALREKETFGRDYLELLHSCLDWEPPQQRKPDRELVSQVLHLALEAYRREEISKGKLRDLSSLLDLPAQTLMELADAV